MLECIVAVSCLVTSVLSCVVLARLSRLLHARVQLLRTVAVWLDAILAIDDKQNAVPHQALETRPRANDRKGAPADGVAQGRESPTARLAGHSSATGWALPIPLCFSPSGIACRTGHCLQRPEDRMYVA